MLISRAMSELWLALGAGAMAGALSIPHCVAMCGPLAAFAGGSGAAFPWRLARYQLGRLGAYALLGVVAGSSGSALAAFATPRWASAALAVLFAAAMVLAAARLMRRERAPGLISLGRTKKRSTPWIARLLARLPREPALVGGLTALLPCGALYSAVLIAAGTGAWSAGALAMSAFAFTSGVGLASSAFFGSRARVSERGRRVLAAALLLGALIVVLRPLLAQDEAPACHPAPTSVTTYPAASEARSSFLGRDRPASSPPLRDA